MPPTADRSSDSACGVRCAQVVRITQILKMAEEAEVKVHFELPL